MVNYNPICWDLAQMGCPPHSKVIDEFYSLQEISSYGHPTLDAHQDHIGFTELDRDKQIVTHSVRK